MTRLRLIIWIIAAIAIVWVLRAAAQMQSDTHCNGLEIRIDYEQGNFFIDKSDIESMIRQQMPSGSLNIPVKDINLSHLETYIEQNPYIANAEAYIDINSKLWIDIEQHYPIVRIIDSQNLSYYLSKEGKKMPASAEYASRVPVVSGNITDNGSDIGEPALPTLKNVFTLAKYIENNQFLKSLIEQIYVAPNGDYVLIPKVGNHDIVFGSIDDMDEKFNNLYLFYQEALPNVGWNKYKTINLKFKGQIVATKIWAKITYPS